MKLPSQHFFVLYHEMFSTAKDYIPCCVFVILKRDFIKLLARFELKISGYYIPFLHVVVPQQHSHTLP